MKKTIRKLTLIIAVMMMVSVFAPTAFGAESGGESAEPAGTETTIEETNATDEIAADETNATDESAKSEIATLAASSSSTSTKESTTEAAGTSTKAATSQTTSKAKKTKVGKVKGVKVKATSYRTLKVSWKKVSKAAGYKVYRATSKNGKYKLIKKTTKTSYKNTGVKTGKKYYYKVVAYAKDKTTGKYSSKVKGATKPNKVKGVKAAAYNKSTVKISWNKAKGATKYKVYRATKKNGRYKLIKTTTKTSYKNTGLSAGKTYYYKVKSYARGKTGTVSSVKSTSSGTGKILKKGSGSDVAKYAKKFVGNP